MRKQDKSGFTLLGSAGALLVAPVLAAGLLFATPLAAEEGGDFTWKLDPLQFGVRGSDIDTNSAKAEEYRDNDAGFVIPKLRLYGTSADGNRTFTLRGDKILRDDGRYQLEYGLAGKYSFFLDYNKIKHQFGNDAALLWNRTGPGRYEISDTLQGALQNTLTTQFAANRSAINFAYLNNLIGPSIAAADRVDVGLERDRATARLELGKSANVSWTIEYAREQRDGTRPFGASFGFNNVTELPEPIDYDTSEATLAGRWNTKGGGLNFGYKYSTFENNISTLIWDNPWRVTDSTDSGAYQGPGSSSVGGAALGFADLAPDNEVASFFASGRWRFGGNWFGGGGITYSKMSQDDPLLPYTLNSAIRGIGFNGQQFTATDPANLPTRTADRKADVLNFNGDLGTRFADDWTFVLRYRFYDYDNKSKAIEFPGYVRFQGVWEDIGRVTVPYAYSNEDIAAEVAWEVSPTANLAVSYTLRSWDREFREIETSDEDVLKGSFDWKPNRVFSLRASAEYGDRSIGDYEVEAQELTFIHPEGVNNLPALRKFDEAARQYDSYNLMLNFLLSDAFTLSFGATQRSDDYDESLFGLVEDELTQYNFDLSYTPGEDMNFYLFGHLADRTALQRNRQSGATPSTREIDTWTADFDEATDTFGLGWTASPGEKWTVDLTGTYAKSDGDIDFTATPGGLPLASPGAGLPARTAAQDIGNYEDFELFSAKLKVDYALTTHTTVGIWYLFEDYTADSFITQGLTNYLPGAILLAANNGNYQANLFALTMKVAF